MVCMFFCEADSPDQDVNVLCRSIIDCVKAEHGIDLFFVAICPGNKLPRTKDNGISPHLTRIMVELGLLQINHLFTNIRRSLKGNNSYTNLAALSESKLEPLNTLQIMDGSSVVSIGKGLGSIDVSTAKNLLEFENISSIFFWRYQNKPNNACFVVRDSKGKGLKTISYLKFNQKVANFASFLTEKKKIKPLQKVILMYTLGLDYVVGVHACLYAGIVAIPFAPIEISKLSDDVEILLKVVKDFDVKYIIVNGFSEEIIKSRQVQNEMKNMKAHFDITLPEIIPALSSIKGNKMMEMSYHDIAVRKFSDSETVGYPLILVCRSANRPIKYVNIAHDTLVAQCVLQKEVCNLQENSPLISCQIPYADLGFIYTVALGIYVGCPTVIISTDDYLANPSYWFDFVSRYKIKDMLVNGNILYTNLAPMLEHAAHSVSQEKQEESQPTNMILENITLQTNDRIIPEQIDYIGQCFTSAYNFHPKILSPSYGCPMNPCISNCCYLNRTRKTLYLDSKYLAKGMLKIMDKQAKGCIVLMDSGKILPGTIVAVIRPVNFVFY
jgi:hypothetical protein